MLIFVGWSPVTLFSDINLTGTGLLVLFRAEQRRFSAASEHCLLRSRTLRSIFISHTVCNVDKDYATNNWLTSWLVLMSGGYCSRNPFEHSKTLRF